MALDHDALWYVDGQWVQPHEATLSINDLAILRGYSVFEALRTYNRRPFHLEEHLKRLYRSAQIIELKIPWQPAFISSIIEESIARNSYDHASIRLLVTGGESEDGLTPSGQPTLVVMITQLGERDTQRFARGIRLITTRLQRESPEAKTTNYMAAVRALSEAARRDASDALFVNASSQLLEATRSNFFIFRGDTLITPREGVLRGITREIVLDLARGHFPIEERPIQLEELAQADEAFLSSSSREITPVVQVDDLLIGNGKPGSRTYELENRFIEMVDRGAW